MIMIHFIIFYVCIHKNHMIDIVLFSFHEKIMKPLMYIPSSGAQLWVATENGGCDKMFVGRQI